MLQYQRGLSLLWVAIFMMVLTSLAVLALFSMRYDRNIALEGWNKLVKNSGSAETIKKSQQAVDNAKSALTGQPKAEAGGLRKCTVNGKITYSDVGCPQNATISKVDIHDAQGFEAPKKPESKDESGSPTASASATLQQKALEKELEKATR